MGETWCYWAWETHKFLQILEGGTYPGGHYGYFKSTLEEIIQSATKWRNIRKLNNQPGDFPLESFCFMFIFYIFFSVGQKRISFEEFLPLYHSQSKKKGGGNFESFAEGFRIFDRDSNGMVNVGEIRHLLTSLGKI